jgi:hypothetical protein
MTPRRFPTAVTLTAVATLAAFGALAASAHPARAQVVGRMPAQAVLTDLGDRQRFGTFAGWLTTGLDPVGLRTNSAPIFGARYDVLMGGPTYFSMRLFGVVSDHDVLDPNAPADNRRIGTASSNQLGFEAAMQLSLTGQRSWRGVQPLVNFGAGIISGVGNHFDGGRYAPGTSVLYSYGLGARFTTGQHSELRADASWLIFQVRYPNHFRTTTADDSTPLRAEGSLTPFTTNRAITLAWTWAIFR